MDNLSNLPHEERIEEPAILLKKIDQLEADLEGMKKDKDVEISRWTAKIAQIEANLKIAKLEADLVDERERNRELERKIAETKRKNDDLEAQLSHPNTEVRDGKVRIGVQDEEINALKSKNSDLETQIQFEKVNKTAEIVKLQADFECEQKERSDEFTKINSKISQSDDRTTKIGADLKEIDSKVAEMSRTFSAKMTQIETDLMGKIAETKKKNDDLEAQLRTQNTEVRDGKVKIGELEGKINALQSKNSGLETQIQSERENKTVEIAKLQADLNRTMTLVLVLDGWSYLAKTASWYKFIARPMTFDEAEAYCASRKSHLVSIHSQEENDFVWKLAKTVNLDSVFWIGLKRNPNKGNAFEWTDGSSEDFTNRFPGDLDSKTHAFLGSDQGKWVAYSPINRFRFICKRSSQF